MDLQKIFLPNEAATLALGERFASQAKPGLIVHLAGKLGTGKTCFVRGVVSGLKGNPEQVKSPTYTLVNEYKTPAIELVHCDFYRLEPSNCLEDLGGGEFFDSPKIFLVEWLSRMDLKNFSIKNQIVRLDFSYEKEGRACSFPSRLGLFL